MNKDPRCASSDYSAGCLSKLFVLQAGHASNDSHLAVTMLYRLPGRNHRQDFINTEHYPASLVVPQWLKKGMWNTNQPVPQNEHVIASAVPLLGRCKWSPLPSYTQPTGDMDSRKSGFASQAIYVLSISRGIHM